MLTLQNIAKKKSFGMAISPEKSETMAFSEGDAVRCKILVNNKCIQVQNFQYLFCAISTKISKICSNTWNSKQRF